MHLQFVEDVLGAMLDGAGRQPVQTTEVFDHFEGGHPFIDGGIVGHETNLAADGLGVTLYVESLDRGDAGRGRQNRTEDSQDGRLAGAIGPEQAKDFARLCGERDAIDRREFSAVQVRIFFGQFVNFDHATPARTACISTNPNFATEESTCS